MRYAVRYPSTVDHSTMTEEIITRMHHLCRGTDRGHRRCFGNMFRASELLMLQVTPLLRLKQMLASCVARFCGGLFQVAMPALVVARYISLHRTPCVSLNGMKKWNSAFTESVFAKLLSSAGRRSSSITLSIRWLVCSPASGHNKGSRILPGL